MKQLSQVLGLSTILFLSNNLLAQDLSFPGIAPSITITAPLNHHIDLNFLTTAKIRLGEHTIKGVRYPSHFLQNYNLLVLSYKLNIHWQIGGGIGYEVNDPFLDTRRNNKRLIQQVQYVLPSDRIRFSNRLRLEERWFRYHYDPPAFGTRVRYQTLFNYKINQHDLSWQLTNEVYAIPSGPRNALLSEDWVSTFIGFPVRSLGHFETGIGLDATVRDKENDWNKLFLLQVNWSFVIGSAHKSKHS